MSEKFGWQSLRVRLAMIRINNLVKHYKDQRQVFITSDQPDKTELIQQTIDDLMEIGMILEKK